ncbi:MAG TPA: ABC transporter substrate-binding protein [Blastocatellia bacterium]|nr:ABC transporter substrate-binding protein [Blastocatellia bacterium]
MIGQRLSNRYEIISELGRGGMGVVYKARDPLLNREVAVKLIPPAILSTESEQRFQREAQLVAQMDFPAVVPIYDFGKHEGSLFFVMPVVQGTNLRGFIREQTLTLGEVIDIGVQIAEALEYSHARGVIHRDIKPENVMVSREEGGRVRVRIMDFGLARAAAESRITKTGTIAGTLAYLSPEQVASASGVDHRSDIYALGTVLYECLTGEPPFSGELQSILYRIVHEIPQPPRSLGAAINEDLETIVLSCIAKDPSKRPQRAGEVADSLRRCQARLHDSDLTKSVLLTRTLILPRPALSPFIGREKELGELQKRLNASISGECQFVVVGGDPGAGKTRLLDEIENLAKARKLLVLHGRSVEQDGAFPYQGFCEAIQEYFRQRDTTTSSSGSIDLSDLASDLVALFPMLTEISDIRSAATGESKLTRVGESQGPENRTHIFELLARTLARIAGGKPLIVFLEDLHAAEVSIEALQYIVRRLGPTPTLIVGTYRTTEVDARHPLMRMLDSFRGDRRFSSIALGPFSPPDHRLFLETLIGGPGLSAALTKRLYEGTEGNPFFTKELVRSLLDSGGITKDNTGSWTLSAETGVSTDALPATIQQAVEKRIERLPEDLRETLSIASVIGKTFDFADLETLAGESEDVEKAVDRLVEDGLIEEERESRGDRLTFSSAVVRDVLYAGISRRKRRSLHRKYAEHIEKRHSGRLERVYPRLVYHFSQGDVPDKTVEYGLRLAKSALDAFSAEEATRSAKTALEFLDEEWEGSRATEGEARLLLAQAHRMAGEVDAALKETEAAIKIFEREKLPQRALAALLLATETAWQARRVEETTRWAPRGIEAARAAGDSESLRHLLSLAATLANFRGEYEKANEYLEEAVRLAPGSKETDAQEEVPRGGRLVVAIANPVKALEPINMELVEEAEILTNVFETLLATDQDGNLVPGLCERWEVANEGKSFVLTLRDNIRFQDGHPLTAEDVKQSFEQAIRHASQELPAAMSAIHGVREYAEQGASALAGMVVHSDYKLEIQLDEPLSIYPALLADYKTGITRATAGIKEPGGLLTGTGPFRLASSESGRITLECNQEYWKGAPAALDAIEFRHGLSASAIASGLRSGEIDLARDLSPQDLEDFLRDPRFRGGLVEAPRKNTYFVMFNSVSGPSARNPTLRRALSGVVRTHDLVWQTLGRFSQPAVCLIPPGMLGHDPGRRRHLLSREEALEMLRAAEVSSPVRLRASVHPLLQDRYGSLLRTLFSIWSDLGVEVEIATTTMSSYLEADQHNEGLDLRIGRWNADYDDPDNFTHSLFHSRVGLYRNYVASAEGDQILEEARAESRPSVRASLYRKYENHLWESGAILPLFHDIDHRLASPKVRRLTLQGSAPYVNYSEIGKVESSTAAPESRRIDGGVIQIPIAGVVTSLDPSLSGTTETGEVLPNIFETLTSDVRGRIVPWLAAEFGADEGGKRYRFRLRDDVRFHDGRRLTARDVRYSFERLLQNRDSECRWFYSSIKGAKALLNGEAADLAGFRIQSAHEFTIELDEPVSLFPALVSYNGSAIVPEGSDHFGESWQEGSVGTGPFRVITFDPGHRLELERNRTYWRSGYPKSDGLIFNFAVSPADILSAFRAGRFSLASDLLPEDVEALRREPDFASGYRETPRLITYYAAFNTRRPPLNDKRLRQSLVQAVDVAAVVRQALGRLAVPAHGLIPPGLLGHDPSHVSRTYPSPSSAPELSSSEVELAAVLNPVFFGEYAALTRELESAFRMRGVRIRPVNKTLAEWIEATTRASVDVVVGRWGADYPDAHTFVNLLHSREGLLGRLCGSPEIDSLIEKGRAEASPVARHSLYRQIEEIIVRDALLLPLFHEQAYRFARPEVEGLSLSYGVTAVDYASLRIRG